MKYNLWLSKLYNDVSSGKKLAIPMASNSKAKDLKIYLNSKFKDLKVKLIHKETSDEEKLNELLNVNEKWIDYDVVIYLLHGCII